MFPPNIWCCKFTDNSSIYKAECEQIMATASKYLLPFAYGNAVKTSSLL